MCSGCRAGRCDESKGAKIACPVCNEKGCSNCDMTGYFYAGCPQQDVDQQTREVIKISEWMDKGFLPCGGGLVDQSASLLEQTKFYQDERDRVEAERYK